MSRRKSLGEIVWPDDDESRRLAIAWAESIVEQALDLVWRAFDHVAANELKDSPDLVEMHPEQLERELTQWHTLAVTSLWAQETGGYASFMPGHELHELESRKGGRAMPPSYDFGFVHSGNKRWKLPLEAKLLPSAQALADYLDDIRKKYLPGIAAPWVGECGMVGYLLAGSADEVFKGLSARLSQRMKRIDCFKDRAHRTTTHARQTAPALRVHHMMMSCGPARKGRTAGSRLGKPSDQRRSPRPRRPKP